MSLGHVYKLVTYCVLTIILCSTACSTTIQSQADQTGQHETMTRKDINAVLKDHDNDLLTIRGVVGVFVGLLPDDKTPCLKVIVTKETEDIKRRIPNFIEGYPVIIEESGVIRPLN